MCHPSTHLLHALRATLYLPARDCLALLPPTTATGLQRSCAAILDTSGEEQVRCTSMRGGTPAIAKTAALQPTCTTLPRGSGNVNGSDGGPAGSESKTKVPLLHSPPRIQACSRHVVYVMIPLASGTCTQTFAHAPLHVHLCMCVFIPGMTLPHALVDLCMPTFAHAPLHMRVCSWQDPASYPGGSLHAHPCTCTFARVCPFLE